MNELKTIAREIAALVEARQAEKFTGRLRVSVDLLFHQGGLRDADMEIGPTVLKIKGNNR